MRRSPNARRAWRAKLVRSVSVSPVHSYGRTSSHTSGRTRYFAGDEECLGPSMGMAT